MEKKTMGKTPVELLSFTGLSTINHPLESGWWFFALPL